MSQNKKNSLITGTGEGIGAAIAIELANKNVHVIITDKSLSNLENTENIIVAMMHTNRTGQSKLLKQCSLPLTGVNCVKKIVSNLAVLEIIDGKFKLLERAPGVSVSEIQKATLGDLIIEGDIPQMKL